MVLLCDMYEKPMNTPSEQSRFRCTRALRVLLQRPLVPMMDEDREQVLEWPKRADVV